MALEMDFCLKGNIIVIFVCNYFGKTLVNQRNLYFYLYYYRRALLNA